MGGRYYISGVQVGMVQAYIQILREHQSRPVAEDVLDHIEELVNRIENVQYLCAAQDDKWKNLMKALNKT